MRKALHPTKLKLMTFKQFDAQRAKDNIVNKIGFKALCFICGNKLWERGAHTKDDGHFGHYKGTDCRATEASDIRYKKLIPSRPNPKVRESNRQFMRENLDPIWNKLCEIDNDIEFMKEFILMLKRAKEIDLYSHSSLAPSKIPYALLTLINFVPSRSFMKRRDCTYRYFYDDKNNDTSDIWIRRGGSSKLYRVKYSRRNEMTDGDEIEQEADYLAMKCRSVLSERQREICLSVI